jgi:hypothetical protein
VSEIVHQELAIEGSECVECPDGFEGECRWMLIGDGRDSLTIEVRATVQAVIARGGRDMDDWLEDRVLSAGASLPNDGRKLKNLAAHSPLVFDSGYVTG